MNTSKIYDLSYQYLLNILPDGLSENDLEKYFIGDNVNYSSLEDIFDRLIFSAQNYRGMPSVINYKKKKNRINELLHNYDLKWISTQRSEILYNIFKNEYHFSTSSNIKQNSWYKWANSIIDSAKFISEFDSVEDFREFVKKFDYNLAMRTALPLLISNKIHGIGFALACDFLKELGFLYYAKPDSHLIDICYETGLCESRNEIDIYETVVKIAEACNVTPYKLDKIFWLICSGDFSIHNKKIKGQKKEFIEYLKKKI